MPPPRVNLRDGIVEMTLSDFIDLYNLAYALVTPAVSDDDPILDTVPHRAFCLCRDCKPGAL